jgi:hypothetical protein
MTSIDHAEFSNHLEALLRDRLDVEIETEEEFYLGQVKLKFTLKYSGRVIASGETRLPSLSALKRLEPDDFD